MKGSDLFELAGRACVAAAGAVADFGVVPDSDSPSTFCSGLDPFVDSGAVFGVEPDCLSPSTAC